MIDEDPFSEGTGGRAWRTRLKAETPGQEATLATWIVTAPWAHPIWHSYMVSVIHLRDLPEVPPAKINLEGATHEVLVAALNPDHELDLGEAHLLTPMNFMGQFVVEDDAAAVTKVEVCVREITAGALSPDTDFQNQWVARFSDSNVKRRKEP